MPGSQMSHRTNDETQRAFLQGDREDLLAVLALRFGAVPESIQAYIAACDNGATLERWILVAANVPDWASFLNDLDAGPQAFKMVGANYEPNPTESGPSAAPDVTSGVREPRRPNKARAKED
jgi:hypothetical protein